MFITIIIIVIILFLWLSQAPGFTFVSSLFVKLNQPAAGFSFIYCANMN